MISSSDYECISSRKDGRTSHSDGSIGRQDELKEPIFVPTGDGVGHLPVCTMVRVSSTECCNDITLRDNVTNGYLQARWMSGEERQPLIS